MEQRAERQKEVGNRCGAQIGQARREARLCVREHGAKKSRITPWAAKEFGSKRVRPAGTSHRRQIPSPIAAR